VRFGIMPAPRSDDGGVTAVNQKLALFESLSAGSRAQSVVRRWDLLFDGPTTPAVQPWLELSSISSILHDSGASMLFCLALVDRTLDARPKGSTAGWNDAITRTALEAAIDRVFSEFGDELGVLSLGNDIDRYLAKVDAGERNDLLALVTHGLDYAKNHPKRPPATVVGVTLTSTGLSAGGAELGALVAASDVAVVSYYPLDATFEAEPPSLVGADLDALAAALTPDGGDGQAGKPIVVQELGYPSATENGSSAAQQNAFYQALFQAIASRRDRFPFLTLNGLYDPPASVCQAEAGALGAPANTAAIASRCSLGLRTSDGTAKPAHASVLAGLAAFATP
jgi:hypothetical protein